MHNNEFPLVSVCIPTYNHEKYIEESVNSVLMQKCQFKIEIIVSDDCSIDGTADKIRELAKKNKNIVIPNYNSNNIGLIKNTIYPLELCRAKYIAYSSGDDFWIDPYKLQKQVDILEKNEDIALCYSNMFSFFEGKEEEKKVFLNTYIPPSVFDLDYYINNKCFVIPPQTILFRKAAFPNPIPSWLNESYNIDWVIPMLIMQKGKSAFINNEMAMYRKHGNNITLTKPFNEVIMNGLKTVLCLDKHFNYKYHHVFGKNQWRYQELVVYYFQKKNYWKGVFWLFYSFFRNPKVFLSSKYFLKTLYKVTFQKFEVYDYIL
jgi:glycosyltransferase involved in cell wall biosynthesis